MPFYKMQASGNDFVVVDNRQGAVRDSLAFTRKVCALHTGIGADGVLFFENSKKADFKMRIINSDGSEAEACGNGFRCISKFAKEVLNFPSEFQFESVSGLIQAHVNYASIKVQLMEPVGYRSGVLKDIVNRDFHYECINTGVPHAVIFVEGLEKIDVVALGPKIRFHETFAPAGTNVNFVEVLGKDSICVRTYERGVEAETLACGTGSSASAITSTLKGYTEPPIQVRTRGGEVLTVNFKIEGKKITDVTLQGEAHFVFKGELLQ
ncbi:MAG: diaminopimelate epimerase [Candidatus Omnitrophica bacterium]|nr:diaminopimelate epimerase [Candidatus Omnitrophota bacterium]